MLLRPTALGLLRSVARRLVGLPGAPARLAAQEGGNPALLPATLPQKDTPRGELHDSGALAREQHAYVAAPTLKILMVSLIDLDKAEGGVSHQFALLDIWRRNGHAVRLIVPRSETQPTEPSISLRDLQYSWRLSRWGVPRIFDALPQIGKIILSRARGYQVIYCRANTMTFVHVLLGRIFGFVTVVEHNSWLSSERASWGGRRWILKVDRRLQIWSARWAHLSRCVTPRIARLLEEGNVDAARLMVLENGTDLERFKPIGRLDAMREIGLDPSLTWLGFIGTLSPWQGLGTAISALDQLRRRDDVRLLIAGDGPERPKLEAMTAQLGLEDRVKFLGKVDLAHANTVINCFDIALAPFTRQRNEEMGLSALKLRDYAAAGRVVVASAVAGVRELADKGWLVTHEPDDPIDLAARLQEVIAARADWPARSRQARAYAVRTFSWEDIVPRLTAAIGRKIDAA